MAIKHEVYTSEKATSISTPIVAESGIPFVVGVAPIHSATNPATVGVPVLCTSWDEAVAKFGFDENWTEDGYNLSQFMYSHFILYGMQPCILLNLLDPSTMKATVPASDYSVINHKVNLGHLAMNNSELVVKSGATSLVVNTDFKVYFNNGALTIELVSTGSAYDAQSLDIAFEVVTPETVTSDAVAVAMEKVELCMTTIGVVPDMLCAPGYYGAALASAMAAKANKINGLFPAKALVDIPTATDGADVYANVLEKKNALGITDENQIVCWPMCGLGGKQYHMSTHLAGVLASSDAENEAPYASPSNRAFLIDSLITEDGSEVLLTLAQANVLNAGGVVTGLNFMGGFKCWGNYTACYPINTDVKDYFIPISRMFDWVSSSLVRTFWSYLDKPMTRILVDTVIDSANIWLNGLTGSGYILGGRIVMIEDENPTTNLMAGIIKLHAYITPPSPMQELEFMLEYDVSYLQEALTVE